MKLQTIKRDKRQDMNIDGTELSGTESFIPYLSFVFDRF